MQLCYTTGNSLNKCDILSHSIIYYSLYFSAYCVTDTMWYVCVRGCSVLRTRRAPRWLNLIHFIPLNSFALSSVPASDPDSEEKETELKASALIDAIVREDVPLVAAVEESSDVTPEASLVKKQKNVLLVDHEDSFVHTLANYLRQTGALN